MAKFQKIWQGRPKRILAKVVRHGAPWFRFAYRDVPSPQLISPETDALLPYFDVEFYLRTYPDIADGGIDPLHHYHNFGWREHRDPSPYFSTQAYLLANPDVASANVNPFWHFIVFGRSEGRAIRPGEQPKSVFAAHLDAASPGRYFEEFDPQIGVGRTPEAKILAYYLPQFHATDVNDSNWGKGFTEWRNIPRGLPRFEGHIQPRLPRDLGYYDLSEGNALRQQFTMAKAGGIHGMVFYHYWFDGKRVLDAPMERFLADPTLDMPFALMWANENWTRTWDGFEREVLLQQNYRPEDDELFITDLARHFIDPRYIRVNGRPLFFIYRPGQVPDATETIARWRDLLWKQHALDPLIYMAQGFGDLDPREFGLDGAIEFPPHKVCQGLPDIADQLRMFDRDYAGTVISYDAMVEESMAERAPEFPLIRTVVPNWDNEARRPGRGMVVHNSTPAKFENWMRGMIRFARSNPTHGDTFVCVNAWNEWAEGAVLEPDVHYGAAYLNSAARACFGLPARSEGRMKVLIVGHDANPNGAQMLAVELGRTMRDFGVEVAYLLLQGGPLLPQYEDIAVTTVLPATDANMLTHLQKLSARGFHMALTNTTVAGAVLPHLKTAGFKVVSLVHELRRLVEAHQLLDQARLLTDHSDRLIFPAEVVRKSFLEITGPAKGVTELLPQGIYKAELTTIPRRPEALRSKLGLPTDTRIVINVGYGDLRKGIDRFIATAISVCSTRPDIHFVWVGDLSPEAVSWHRPEIERAGLSEQIHITGFQPDVTHWYMGADLLFLSSREDPFPSVVLEALGAGIPVVGYAATGGCDDLILRHGRLVPATDPSSAAEAILGVLDSPAAQKLAAATESRDQIGRDYRFDNYAHALLRRFDQKLSTASVIVPNYNYSRYIGDRLRSVFNQVHPVLEVLVLDDASVDGSVQEIRRVTEAERRRIALIENETNSGSPFKQWRKGVSLVRGDFVWIAEADDLADSELLTEIIDRMQAAGSAIGFCDSRQIDENGRNLGESYRSYLNEVEPGAFDQSFDMSGLEFLARFLTVKNVILNVSSAVFRRDALAAGIDAIGDELDTWQVAGDWRLYSEICGAGGGVSFVAKALNTHRRHSGSVTHALNTERHLAEMAEMHRKLAAMVALSSTVQLKQKESIAAARRHLQIA